MKTILKRNVLSLFVIAATLAFGFSISAPQAGGSLTGKYFGGGAVEIHAGAYLNGCVTGSSGTILFTTDGSGNAYISGLSAGTYYVCVENWGNTSFYNDGASEGVVTVPNNADCKC
jgi:hypothetical protein